MDNWHQSRKKSIFLKIACPRCGSRMTVFGKCSINVKCSKCNYLLVRSGGGKAKIRAPVKGIM